MTKLPIMDWETQPAICLRQKSLPFSFYAQKKPICTRCTRRGLIPIQKDPKDTHPLYRLTFVVNVVWMTEFLRAQN